MLVPLFVLGTFFESFQPYLQTSLQTNHDLKTSRTRKAKSILWPLQHSIKLQRNPIFLDEILILMKWSAAVVICPKCRHRSVVNRSRLRGYALSFFLVGFILLAIGIGVTVATYIAAESSYGGIF